MKRISIIRTFAVISLSAAMLQSCNMTNMNNLTVTVPGSDKITIASAEMASEEINTGMVSEIKIENLAKLRFSNEIPDGMMRITYPENLKDIFTVDVHDGKLVSGFSSSVKFENRDNIPTITLPISSAVEDIYAQGTVEISSNDTLRTDELDIRSSGASSIGLQLECETIDIEISGASKLDLSGKCANVSIETSGASAINCGDFYADYCEISCSGASKATVYAEKEISIDCSGGSYVTVKGNGKIVRQSVSGASKINKE